MVTATLPAKTRPAAKTPRPFKPATAPARGTVLPMVRITTEAGVVSDFGLSFPRPDPAVATACVRLTKADGEMYDISLGTDGVARCDCPDGTFHPERPGGGCKHLNAVRALVRRMAVLTALAEAPTEAGPVPAAA